MMQNYTTIVTILYYGTCKHAKGTQGGQGGRGGRQGRGS